MKTTMNIAMIVSALTIGFAGSLSASTPGKHAFDEAGPHMHVSKSTAYSSGASQTLITHVGAPGKGLDISGK